MSYFVSPQAEFKAKRIAQMLAPNSTIAACRDGTVMCNTNGHVYVFTLDENKNLKLVDTVDFIRPNNPPTIVIE